MSMWCIVPLLVRALFLVCSWSQYCLPPSCHVLPWWRRRSSLSSFFLIWATLQFVKSSPLCPNYLPSVPFAHSITLEFRPSNYEFGVTQAFAPINKSNAFSVFSPGVFLSSFVTIRSINNDWDKVMSSFHSTNVAALLVSAFREQLIVLLILFLEHDHLVMTVQLI